MAVKTAKFLTALDACIRRAALARDAIARGLQKSEAIDMHSALAGFLGALEDLRDLSTNKNYVRTFVPKRAC